MKPPLRPPPAGVLRGATSPERPCSGDRDLYRRLHRRSLYRPACRHGHQEARKEKSSCLTGAFNYSLFFLLYSLFFKNQVEHCCAVR